MNKKGVIILSGYNIRAVIAFCRWAIDHTINFHIVALGNDDPIYQTVYKDFVEYKRTSPTLCLEKFIVWISKIKETNKYKKLLILPTSEFLNRFLLEHRYYFEKNNCIVPLVPKKTYELVSNKKDFAVLCKSYGLDVPEEFDSIPAKPPFVAKPKYYSSSTGEQLTPQLITTNQEMHDFKQKDMSGYFFQKFISGNSLYLLSYIGANEVQVFSQENLIQQSKGGSIILARRSDLHTKPITEKYIKMLQDVGFSGLIMIELRESTSNGKYYMIEANPRPWGPIQFTIDNDIDLFGQMLTDHNFEVNQPHSSSKYNYDFYFWSGGFYKAAQPVAFHSYTAEEFIQDLPEIRNQDIFLRKDTFNLFCKESGVLDESF